MTKTCKNCGTVLHGKYCFNCGQKTILPSDKKLVHLLTEFFHHFTHLDSKFIGTLKKILFTPGKVTRDISHGITVPHFKLSALFLIGTIIYYLLPSELVVTSPANESYQKQTSEGQYREWKSGFAKRKSISERVSLQVLQVRYDQRQHDYGKLLTLLLIPMLIPVLWILGKMIKKFNPGNTFTAYDLGVASLEINSLILFGFYLTTGILIWLATRIYGNENVSLVGFYIFLAALLLQLFSFFRRAYEIRWWQSLVCVIITIFAYIYILNLFSVISFLLFI